MGSLRQELEFSYEVDALVALRTIPDTGILQHMFHGQKSRLFGDGRPPTFNRNPYNWYIKPYYWVDDHPLVYGNNGSLDPSTYGSLM